MVAAVTSEWRGRKSGGRRPVVKSMEGNTWNRLFVREGGRNRGDRKRAEMRGARLFSSPFYASSLPFVRLSWNKLREEYDRWPFQVFDKDPHLEHDLWLFYSPAACRINPVSKMSPDSWSFVRGKEEVFGRKLSEIRRFIFVEVMEILKDRARGGILCSIAQFLIQNDRLFCD